jgi:hypothetical protein
VGVPVFVGVGVGGISGITITQPQLGITDVVITSVIIPYPVAPDDDWEPLVIVLDQLY